eukprot:gnl/MRDRNA2_/MRDRNA2_94901_c0_seq1.p1 gnl/MRDRNA2_/MRDRNA2_94901_c0~~gnl/MRDRNA2_/MRDRNA2_94901_c0_seq1.p1  ORF type:complete len:147 (+),score=28.58 gnl/MRDRNA2_/MRDRNA2_94901_c0_seq1:84-524(+)
MSSVSCRGLLLSALVLVASLLQGCEECCPNCDKIGIPISGCEASCSKLGGVDKKECEACAKNVEDTPFENKGFKAELKQKCAEGSEARKEVHDAVHERMEDNHLETKTDDPISMLALGKGMRKKSFLSADENPSVSVGHGVAWYLP